MIRSRCVGVCIVAVLAVALVGCQRPPMEMKAPDRPMELDRLDMFVGTWDATEEFKMADSEEVKTSKGTETWNWDADRWLLVGHFESEMEEERDKRGMMVVTWDPKAAKYRFWSFSNWGDRGMGTMTYDEQAQTWHFTGESQNPATGKKRLGKGTMKCVDADTQEWTFTVRDCLGLRKVKEGTETSRRR